MNDKLKQELKRIRQLSPRQFVKEYNATDGEIYHTPENVQMLIEKINTLLAGANDVQMLALAADHTEQFGMLDNTEAIARAVEALWSRRAATASELGIPGVAALAPGAASEIADNIKRSAEARKEVKEKSDRLDEFFREGNIPKI